MREHCYRGGRSWKTFLLEAADAERTIEATWKRLGVLLQSFTPQECANYLENALQPRKSLFRLLICTIRDITPARK